MVKEGIAQSLLFNKSHLCKLTLKQWMSELIQDSEEVSIPEKEILASQILKIYRCMPISLEDIEGLTNLAARSSWQLKISICNILREQLFSDNLSTIIRSGVFQKIGDFLERESDVLNELLKWNEITKNHMATIMHEELIQQCDGLNNKQLGIIQKAVIINSGGFTNLKISQNIKNAQITGRITQIVKT
jgi:hypothetical protein